jgi:hypothetical protein
VLGILQVPAEPTQQRAGAQRRAFVVLGDGHLRKIHQVSLDQVVIAHAEEASLVAREVEPALGQRSAMALAAVFVEHGLDDARKIH